MSRRIYMSAALSAACVAGSTAAFAITAFLVGAPWQITVGLCGDAIAATIVSAYVVARR